MFPLFVVSPKVIRNAKNFGVNNIKISLFFYFFYRSFFKSFTQLKVSSGNRIIPGRFRGWIR